MAMQKTALLLMTVLLVMSASASEWTLSLEPISMPGMPGVQAFACAEYEGSIVVIGGRRDGLHGFRPVDSFREEYNNRTVFVVNPETGTVDSARLDGLATPVSEQLESTNMEFQMVGNHLVVIGGYGYAASVNDHITHPRLTVVDVPGLIDDVKNGRSIASRFRSIEDDRFAVTGGYLGCVGDTLILAGGQRFDGRYNPMGGPSFTQVYTNAVLRFTLELEGPSLAVTEISRDVDQEHLHRRDYNMLPQIFPDGRHGHTMFSGVFQHDVDLPFLHPVDVTTSGYEPRTEFSQYLNHYHSSSFAVFDSTTMEQHSYFLGGMSQYYVNDEGTLVQDDQVPFVRTIARVSRASDGSLTESRLSVQMPDLEGSSAEFVMNPQMPHTEHGVILAHRFTADTIPVGWVIGGIRSTDRNIFFSMDHDLSEASATMYRVVLLRSPETSVNDVEVHQAHAFELVSARSVDSSIRVDVELTRPGDVMLRLYDYEGRLLEKFHEQSAPAGKRTFLLPLRDYRGPILVAVQAHGRVLTAKVQ